ncbi:hypothetical protein P4872_004058 [Escherichia coli]|nr:hypothetical protein [Escherichia coli]
MSEVKIYTLVMGEKEILNFKHGEELRVGEFVKYKDYAALEAKCDELLKEIKNMRDQALDDGCRIAELEEALRDKQALIPDGHDTTAQQFESLSNHKHHFINGTCVECLKSE